MAITITRQEERNFKHQTKRKKKKKKKIKMYI